MSDAAALAAAPSLRRRLAGFLLIPMAALAVALAIGGTIYVNLFVTRSFDRVLAGSVLSIAERLSLEADHVTVDLPSAALGMLSNSQHDSIFYNVTSDGAFVTGYEDLDLPKVSPELYVVTFRDGAFRGQPIRIGMLLKPVYASGRTALVQVAETVNGRDLLKRQMLTALALLGAALATIGCSLVWFAVRAGLSPLDGLRREVERRQLDRKAAVEPFAVAGVPREALPLVGALNRLLGRLNHSIETVRRFTADASHQLRTPIAILKTHVDLLDRQPPKSEEWRSSRSDIDAALERLERLIAQLLTLASLEEGAAVDPGAAKVELVSLVRGVARDFALAARRRDVDLSLEACETPIEVAAAPMLVEEALRNLIDNALRYGRPGGAVRIGVARVEGETGRVFVEVEDDGPGIPETERERVFERFYRIDGSSETGGSGLGLPIVRAFVDHLGGAISLSDGRSGQGLTARIELAASPSQ